MGRVLNDLERLGIHAACVLLKAKLAADGVVPPRLNRPKLLTQLFYLCSRAESVDPLLRLSSE